MKGRGFARGCFRRKKKLFIPKGWLSKDIFSGKLLFPTQNSRDGITMPPKKLKATQNQKPQQSREASREQSLSREVTSHSKYYRTTRSEVSVTADY